MPKIGEIKSGKKIEGCPPFLTTFSPKNKKENKKEKESKL